MPCFAYINGTIYTTQELQNINDNKRRMFMYFKTTYDTEFDDLWYAPKGKVSPETI